MLILGHILMSYHFVEFAFFI